MFRSVFFSAGVLDKHNAAQPVFSTEAVLLCSVEFCVGTLGAQGTETDSTDEKAAEKCGKFPTFYTGFSTNICGKLQYI